MKLAWKIVILSTLIIAFIFLFYYIRLSDYFTLQKLQEHHEALKLFVQNHYLLSVLIYIGTFSLALILGLPIVIPFAMIGGFLYGIYLGVIYAGISCLIGSVLSFLLLRYVIGDWVRGWQSERIKRFIAQLQKYGSNYLLMLHFLSVVPLLVINGIAALANVPLITVIWVTIIGTLPLNFLCAYTGKELSSIRSFSDIFTPTIITLLVILAVIALAPIIIRKIKGSVGV